MKKDLLKYISKIGLLVSLVALPVSVFATVTGVVNTTNVGTLSISIISIIDSAIIPLIFAIAMVVFVWGVVQYFIIGAAEETKREAGKQLMIWGLIGLAVMVGIWGLVFLIVRTFGFNTVLPQTTDLPV